ncbi:tigger transposable element-derived protein 6-like [Anoplophora glabripennis]|uniref:tigger transposable element-derived protein 6-like n=1 Tax=Anoplophora glabripennis TaxID=217634 RepID=UPI0008748306|nr:tigger transposable element-derived protein 6-like [Anoplophora glabripennis]
MSPSVYKRKPNSKPRGVWSEADLRNAVHDIGEGTGVNAAAKQFGIPKTTLKRRLKRKSFTVENRLGPSSSLGSEAETKLARHIIKLQRNGFCPTRTEVRANAFELAEKLKIPHKFNKGTRLAGMDWLRSYLRRNPEIRVRKAEGVSTARTLGLSKTVVKNYFELLENLMRSNDLFDKPGRVFNVDETGLQLNNKPGHVLAQRGSKSVSVVTSGEKGETISVIACCNAEGSFLPPYCIFKGENKKDEFADRMPPASEVVMSQKSAYVNLQIFQNWIKDHFPRKPHGKVLLVLDGHTSHTASVETLEFCEQNDIILLSLPSHTTHYLQPLDGSFFKSLKTFYYADCNSYMRSNPGRRITRLNFGALLGSSWARAATVQNAASGFKATGIMPFNPGEIPDYAFLSDVERTDDTNNSPINSPSNSSRNSPNSQIELVEEEIENINLPSTSGLHLKSKRKDPKKRNIEENYSLVNKNTTPKKNVYSNYIASRI